MLEPVSGMPGTGRTAKLVVAESGPQDATTVYVPIAVPEVMVTVATPDALTGAVVTMGVPPLGGVMVKVTMPPTHSLNPLAVMMTGEPGT